MSQAYSVELRAHVVAADQAEEGSRAEIGRRFNVGEASVNRWTSLARKRGSLEPTKRASRPSQLLTTEGLEFIRLALRRCAQSSRIVGLKQRSSKTRERGCGGPPASSLGLASPRV